MINYIQFFPTFRCNRKCKSCFSRDFKGEDFPSEKIDALVDILVKNKIPSLDILGGEPFLYEALDRLISSATSNSIEVTLSTNGTLTGSIKKFLECYNFRNFKIGVSINEPPSEELLKIIAEHRIWIKTLFSREAFLDRKVLEFAKKSSIDYYLIYMDALSEAELSQSMPFYEFMEKVENLRETFPNIKPVYCKGFIGGEKYRCPAGTEKITLFPDGSVYPCYLLAGKKDFLLGNIFSNHLSEILSSPIMDVFRSFQRNQCKKEDCKFYKHCRGGCVAHSFAHLGNLQGVDPRCNMNKGGSNDKNY